MPFGTGPKPFSASCLVTRSKAAPTIVWLTVEFQHRLDWCLYLRPTELSSVHHCFTAREEWLLSDWGDLLLSRYRKLEIQLRVKTESLFGTLQIQWMWRNQRPCRCRSHRQCRCSEPGRAEFTARAENTVRTRQGIYRNVTRRVQPPDLEDWHRELTNHQRNNDLTTHHRNASQI